MTEALSLVLQGTSFACALMLILWCFYLAKGDPSLVDIGWSSSIGVMGWLYYFSSYGGSPRNWIVLVAVTYWSGRLTWLLIHRLRKGQKDLRYAELSERWQTGLPWKYFIFYQAQAVLAGILSLPIAMAMRFPYGSLQNADYLAIALIILGSLGETSADETLRRFRSKPENKGLICKEGLWKYTRHPNYFFEWLNWVGFALFAWPTTWGWLGMISPLIMYYSITRVTGIPPTEAHLEKSKGPAYSVYRKTTHAFFPWFPKKF